MSKFKVGDYARNVESGWLGRIEEITSAEVDIDGTRSYTEVTAKMIGVDELCTMCAGTRIEVSLSENDIQWHDVKDLIPFKIEP